jgi:hypothetical protein
MEGRQAPVLKAGSFLLMYVLRPLDSLWLSENTRAFNQEGSRSHVDQQSRFGRGGTNCAQ